MEITTDNLYIKRDNHNNLTRELLFFLDSAILDIKKITRRRINIFSIKLANLKDDNTKKALHARGVMRLPALYIPEGPTTIHGVDNIKEFYIKLMSCMQQQIQSVQDNDEHLIDNGDPYEQMFKSEMMSNSQDQGGSESMTGRSVSTTRTMSAGDDDEEDTIDFGSKMRDRMMRKPTHPGKGGGKGMVPSTPLPPPTNRDKPVKPLASNANSSVMDSVKKIASNGPDGDLEIEFFKNILEETPV